MKKLIPLCLSLLLCSCSSADVTDEITSDIIMKNEEVVTEITTTEDIVLAQEEYIETDFVNQIGFKPSEDAVISSAGESGCTIEFTTSGKRGFIAIMISSQEFNDYDRQTQDIASHVEGSYIQDSHILNGFREIVYTNTVDYMGDVTRLIEYKKYSNTETFVITIYLPKEDYDILIDKAVEIVQSLKV